jgi:integrase
LHEERYIKEKINIRMPRIEQKRLPVLSLEEVQIVLEACNNLRDTAIILMLVDTGLRRGEVCSLDWGDVNLSSGLCLVRKSKGKKARSVVIGIRTRRALLKYKQAVASDDNDPLFQSVTGNRLSGGGLRSLCLRLSERIDIHITPHVLRRTFVVLSLTSGMSLAWT